LEQKEDDDDEDEDDEDNGVDADADAERNTRNMTPGPLERLAVESRLEALSLGAVIPDPEGTSGTAVAAENALCPPSSDELSDGWLQSNRDSVACHDGTAWTAAWPLPSRSAVIQTMTSLKGDEAEAKAAVE